MRVSNPRKAAVAAIIVVLAAAAWMSFGPRQLGGSMTYVTTFGTSMEPVLHRGDLVLVRPASEYRAGDIVAYRSSQLRTLVLHRIVGMQGDRFVFKGDNNSWLDVERPARSDLLGRLTVRLPGMGTWLGRLRSPAGILLVFGSATLLAAGSRRRRRFRPEIWRSDVSEGARNGGSRTNPNEARPGFGSDRLRIASAVAGALAIVLLAGTVILLLVPTSARSIVEIPYNDRGELSYSARISNSQAVYEGSVVRTGQPLYLRLGTTLRVAFRYSLDTTGSVSTQGKIGLTAAVADGNGWARTFDLGTPASLTPAGTGVVRGTLDVGRIRSILRGLERSTGVFRDHYTVTVGGRVDIHGTVAGGSVDHVFAPSVGLVLDSEELQLDRSTGPGGSSADAFHPVQGGTVRTGIREPNRLTILGREVDVSALRLLGMALALLFAIAFWSLRRGAASVPSHDEVARIEDRYGRWLIPVKATGVNGSAIEVETMDSLALIAEQNGGVILHERRADAHDYLVEAGGQVYRYRVPEGARSNGHREPSPAAAEKG
jgi:signal peptidase I